MIPNVIGKMIPNVIGKMRPNVIGKMRPNVIGLGLNSLLIYQYPTHFSITIYGLVICIIYVKNIYYNKVKVYCLGSRILFRFSNSKKNFV